MDSNARETTVLKGKLNSMEKTSNSRFDSIEMTQLQHSESFAEVTSGLGRNIEKLAAEFIRLNQRRCYAIDHEFFPECLFSSNIIDKIPTWSQHLGLQQEF